MRHGLEAAALVAALAVAPLAAGCSRQSSGSDLPAGCKVGGREVRTALAHAPAGVRLPDGTRLSSCFTARSDQADLEQVGATFVGVAGGLAAAAHGHPDGAASVQLGYLIGAVRRGTSRTAGIHGELVRRIEQELVFVDIRSAVFRRGERAGRSSG